MPQGSAQGPAGVPSREQSGDPGAGGVGPPAGDAEAAGELRCRRRDIPAWAEQTRLSTAVSAVSVSWVQLLWGVQPSQDRSFLGARGRGQVSVAKATCRLHACAFPFSRRPGNIRSEATGSGRLGESSRWVRGVWAQETGREVLSNGRSCISLQPAPRVTPSSPLRPALTGLPATDPGPFQDPGTASLACPIAHQCWKREAGGWVIMPAPGLGAGGRASLFIRGGTHRAPSFCSCFWTLLDAPVVPASGPTLCPLPG